MTTETAPPAGSTREVHAPFSFARLCAGPREPAAPTAPREALEELVIVTTIPYADPAAVRSASDAAILAALARARREAEVDAQQLEAIRAEILQLQQALAELQEHPWAPVVAALEAESVRRRDALAAAQSA